MTLLAGIFSRKNDILISDEDCGAIKSVISRNANDEAAEFRNRSIFIAKVDIGVYGETAFQIDSDGCVSMLAGDPLLLNENPGLSKGRQKDLKELHSAWKTNRWEILTRVRGVFCAAHFSPYDTRLTLISDKLCIRPLYYFVSDNYVIFASALRILESFPMVTKCMNMRAIMEITALGYPLGTRTPYVNILLLKAAEIVHFYQDSSSHFQYFRWDHIGQLEKSEGDLLCDAYNRFSTAVECRIGADKKTISFLSGGLDSRCIVAELRKRNIQVHTFNFSNTNTQDYMFSREFAVRSGVIHSHRPLNRGVTLSKMISSAWATASHSSPHHVERPGLVWSGDGGSVGVGHVYVSKGIINSMRYGDSVRAINLFIEDQQAKILVRLFKPAILSSFANAVPNGIHEEINDIESDDPAKSFHIFLMLNDQRRHLATHFEEIDLHRVEFHLPFFDSHFLEWILACPIDLLVGHHFYVKWLNLFPSFVQSVPWQTYPGHVPSPLPIPECLHSQWNYTYFKKRKKETRKALMQVSSNLLRSEEFPDIILNKRWLLMAMWIFRMGLRDYGYLISAAEKVVRFWRICNGKYSLC